MSEEEVHYEDEATDAWTQQRQLDGTAFMYQPITCLAEGKIFIDELIGKDMSFHLEDDPADIIKGGTDDTLFTEQQAEAIEKRVTELYAIEWGEYDCPIGYMMAEERRRNPEKYS